MSEPKSICTGCNKPIDGDLSYASIGGNFVPYIAAKLYHISCIPVFKPSVDMENKCYAVVFMNYFPLEVDSLWKTRDGAKNRIRELTNPGNWDVCEMTIQDS